MSSLPFKELKIDDLINNRVYANFLSITLKRDGTMMYFKDGNLISDLKTKTEIIIENVKLINNPAITPLIFFHNIQEGWNYVENYNQEGSN